MVEDSARIAESFLGIFFEELEDEVPQLVGVRYSHLIWYLHWSVQNGLRNSRFDFRPIERMRANEHVVQDAPHGPPIGTLVIAFP